MRVVSIAEVKSLDPKEVIPCVRGRLVEVVKRQTGEKDGKHWSIQRFKIKDNTGEVWVKAWDNDTEIPLSAKGQGILIECNDGNKGKTGVYAHDNEYNGKVERQIRLTASAKIDIENGNGAHEAPQTQRAPEPDDERELADKGLAPVQPPPQAPAKTNGNGTEHGDVVRNAAKRCARDYYRCMEQVLEMRTAWDKANPEAAMTDAHFQAACASVYIQLSRDGVVNGNGR